MKKIFFVLILIFSVSVNAQNQEVQKTIKTFFDAFHTKDTVK